MGVPGQRADRRGRGDRRLAPAACRSGHPGPRPDALGAALITLGVAALTLGLVKGNDWGWGAVATVAILVVAALALALFAVRIARAANPLVDGRLFAVRAFSGASVVALAFSIAFGAMLVSIVLWCQDVWGWSALTTGLAVAPGALMVPLFSFLLAGRLIARVGPGPVIGVGATVFAAGIMWWALAAGLTPDYAGEMLGGMLPTGAGVGLTLPTFMATGAASLPAHALATGSAVINMLRQVGLAVGVAALVAVLGVTSRGGDPTGAFQRGWVVIASASLLAAIAGLLMLRPSRAAVGIAQPGSGG